MRYEHVIIALLVAVALLQIVTIVVLVAAKSIKSPSEPYIPDYSQGVKTLNEIREERNTPKITLFDRNRRAIINDKLFVFLESDEVIASQVGNSLLVYDQRGGDQEYIKPCGQFVLGEVGDITGSTFCVLPETHRGRNHVDMYGNKKKVETP